MVITNKEITKVVYKEKTNLLYTLSVQLQFWLLTLQIYF